MQDYRELKVWQKAHQLTLKVYDITQYLPSDERYGLTSQLRRAAVSVPTNLAEGSGRGTAAELAQFAQIAAGSTSEMEYLLQLSADLGYLDAKAVESTHLDIRELRKMLTAFIRTLRNKRESWTTDH